MTLRPGRTGGISVFAGFAFPGAAAGNLFPVCSGAADIADRCRT